MWFYSLASVRFVKEGYTERKYGMADEDDPVEHEVK